MKLPIMPFFAASLLLVAASVMAADRKWAPTDEANTNLADGDNWDPVFGDDYPTEDTLSINSTTNATLETDFTTKTLFVGGGSSFLEEDANNDNGARLDVFDGTLTVSDTLWVGGGYSDLYDSILNLSGTGHIVANRIVTGDCAANSSKQDHPKTCVINLSGGTLETAGEVKLGNYRESRTVFNQTGGVFAPGGQLKIGEQGTATCNFSGGTYTAPNEAFVGMYGYTGVANFDTDVTLHTMQVGREGGTGTVNINAGKASFEAAEDWWTGFNLGWGSGSKGYLNIAEGATFETAATETRGGGNRIKMCRDNGTYTEINVRGSLIDNYIANSWWQEGLVIALADMNNDTGAISESVLNNWGKTYSRGGIRVAQGTGSKGTLNIYGGRVENGGMFAAGWGDKSNARVYMDGGALVVTRDPLAEREPLMDFGRGRAAHTEVQIDGGVVSNLVERIRIGADGDAETYTKFVLNGGAVYAAQNIYAGAWTSADVTINGGVLETEESVVLGEWIMEGDRTAKLCANGGTVFAKRVVRTYSGNSPTTIIKVSGGTFKAKESTEQYFENCGELQIMGDGIVFDTDGHDVALSYGGLTLRGDGGFTKKGDGVLEVRGTYALNGKITVLAGTLKLPAYQTIYCEGTEIADGATLDTNGSSIIRIEKKIVSSVWTNAAGDGDAMNPENWRSVVKYFYDDGSEKEDMGATLDGVMPVEHTDVTIPADVSVRPDMSRLTVKSVTFVVADSIFLRGDCTVPEIVKTAKAWYDFDDPATVAMSDGIPVGVENKGTAGETLDLQLFHPEAERRKPAYGISARYGRNVMSFTNSFGFVSRDAAGIAGNDDRTLVAVSLRIRNTYPSLEENGMPKEGVFENQLFQIGLEAAMWNPNYGEFRIGQWDGSSHLDYDDANVPEHGFQCLPGLRDINPDEYAIWTMSSNDKTVSGSVMTESTGVENAESVTTGGNETYETAKLFVGMRQLYDTPSAGEIAEAMMFDKALSDEELDAVRDYLYAKWYTAKDLSNVPGDIMLENGATLDFGGGSWAFGSLAGSGTIANVAVAGESLVIRVAVAPDGSMNKIVFPEGSTVRDLTIVVDNPKKVPLAGAQIAKNLTVADGGAIMLVDAAGNDCSGFVRADSKNGGITLAGRRGFAIFVR